mmetsp:Transcript_23369/g.32742  ORF Transcript_23369/g.32742 Transcript_23369/m.32742 type:complete len:382 (+) Transcript_23369:296-1441(+)
MKLGNHIVRFVIGNLFVLSCNSFQYHTISSFGAKTAVRTLSSTKRSSFSSLYMLNQQRLGMGQRRLFTSRCPSVADTENSCGESRSSSPGTATSSSFSGQEQQPTFDLYPASSLDQLRKGNKHDVRLVHFIRHAEGYHNVNKEYRDIRNLDARLTPKGEKQCAYQASSVASMMSSCQPDLLVTSTLTRCIQTALLSFPHLIDNHNSSNNNNNHNQEMIPFLAHEDIRETVNYACDRRRQITEIATEFPMVDFSAIPHEHDEIWSSYEERLGPSHNTARESVELHKVADRGRSFFQWIQSRKEQEIVICTHSAFMRCIFGWGQSNGGVLNAMDQVLDMRDKEMEFDVPVFRYCGDDETFETHMRQDYDNCEMRSCVIAFPKN